MLYVDVRVHNHPIKAFVDSGAQSTIMSPSCAEACGIHHLIDERYAGVARGVGTAKILGRVHNAKIQIGDAELDCAFTVMEGKDVDLLFGLDMLRRHQACINLKHNKLQFPHTEVPFLGESEIPKRWEKEMMDEGVVQGPDGTEIGTKTGTVRLAGSSAQAAKELHSQNGNMTPRPQANAGAPASVAGSSTGQGQSRWSEKDINQLISLGFSKLEAIAALDATDGNVEYAAGLLFGR
jgi:DNA damage-inducible protein 1